MPKRPRPSDRPRRGRVADTAATGPAATGPAAHPARATAPGTPPAATDPPGAASSPALGERRLASDGPFGRLSHRLPALQAQRAAAGPAEVLLRMAAEDLDGALALVAIQTRRRENAEQAAEASAREAARLLLEVARLGLVIDRLKRERLPSDPRSPVSGPRDG